MSSRRKPPTDPITRLRTMRADIHRMIADGIEIGMPEEAEGHLTAAADNLSDAEEFLADEPPGVEATAQATETTAATEGEPS